MEGIMKILKKKKKTSLKTERDYHSFSSLNGHLIVYQIILFGRYYIIPFRVTLTHSFARYRNRWIIILL